MPVEAGKTIEMGTGASGLFFENLVPWKQSKRPTNPLFSIVLREAIVPTNGSGHYGIWGDGAGTAVLVEG
ncbi:MAG: hypothetical protein MI741_03085 [Rhodospirillales bacterium]|nr:hypothetical protein [Rhodospirillales bacterium]